MFSAFLAFFLMIWIELWSSTFGLQNNLKLCDKSNTCIFIPGLGGGREGNCAALNEDTCAKKLTLSLEQIAIFWGKRTLLCILKSLNFSSQIAFMLGSSSVFLTESSPASTSDTRQNQQNAGQK